MRFLGPLAFVASEAAGVAEGGLKPASDLAYSTVDEPVRKIATVLTISDELVAVLVLLVRPPGVIVAIIAVVVAGVLLKR